MKKSRPFIFSAPLFYLPIFLFLLSSCASAPRKTYSIGYHEAGLASWYGKDFHGRPTSSGEVYDMFGLSAAHKTLPLGSLLRVTEIQSGRAVEVKVNDRGPFVGDRILDLSFGAAKVLGFEERGLAKVEIEIVGFVPVGKRARAGSGFLVQVGSYQIEENALRMKERVARHDQKVYTEFFEGNFGTFYRVRIGPYRSEDEAHAAAARLSKAISVEEKITPVVIRAN